MASRRCCGLRVLIVEDDKRVATRLKERLSEMKPSIDSVIATSLSSGVAALRSQEFDFIICDLRLPPQDGGVNTAEVHGLAVYSEAHTICPGTPRLFFTGFATSQNVREQLSSGGTHDVFGTGENYPMTRMLTKDEFSACVERLNEFNSELAILDTIGIELSSSESSLDGMETRALQLAARLLGGTSIEASAQGGLSGAQTLRAVVKNNDGRAHGFYFAKIDLWTRLKQERENYYLHVSPMLRIGDFPALVQEIEAGIGKRAALFYQLADGYTKSLFDVLEEHESDAISVIGALRDILAPWVNAKEKKTIRLRDIRTQRIDDETFEPYQDVLGSAEAFEEIKLEMTTSCQHGDLHGLNVLCKTSEEVVVIDFGNVGPAPICTDPVTLELSVLFHRDSPFRNSSWPTNKQAEAWFNLEEYLVGCPVPDFIRECREWASETDGASALSPVVYAQSVQQLKYEDTNHELALGIARAAIQKGI